MSCYEIEVMWLFWSCSNRCYPAHMRLHMAWVTMGEMACCYNLPCLQHVFIAKLSCWSFANKLNPGWVWDHMAIKRDIKSLNSCSCLDLNICVTQIKNTPIGSFNSLQGGWVEIWRPVSFQCTRLAGIWLNIYNLPKKHNSSPIAYYQSKLTLHGLQVPRVWNKSQTMGRSVY